MRSVRSSGLWRETKWMVGALLMLCWAAPALAQTSGSAIAVGAKVGLNRATMAVPSEDLETGVEIESIRGIVGGVWVQRDMSSGLMFRVEGLFSQKGMSPAVNQTLFGDVLDAKLNVRLNYFDLPMLVGWQSQTTDGPKFSMFVGPTLSLKFSSSFSVESVELNGQDVTRELGGDIEDELDTFDFDEALSATDFGLTAGVGVAVGQFTIDMRYTLGLVDVSTRADSADTKNRTLSLMFGYRFR